MKSNYLLIQVIKKRGQGILSKILVALLLAFVLQSEHAVSQCVIVSSKIKSDFNDVKIKSGNYIWFSCNVQVKNISTYPVTITFANQTISSSKFTIHVPNGKLILTNAVTQTTTVWDTVGNDEWITTSPPHGNNEYFLSGVAYLVPSGGIAAKHGKVTWEGNFFTTVANAKVSWEWHAAVYTNDISDYANLPIQPIGDSHYSPYNNSDEAGSLETNTRHSPRGHSCKGARSDRDDDGHGVGTGDAIAIPGLCCINLGIVATGPVYYCANQGNTLTVTGNATSFYWVANGSTSGTLAVPPGQAGLFTVIGTSAEGCEGTASINLQVDPVINVNTNHSLFVPEGGTITLSASASGGYPTDPICLLWNGPNGYSANITCPVGGGACPDVTIPNATAADAGAYVAYVVKATDCFGSACTTYDTSRVNIVSARLAQSTQTDFKVYPNPAHDRLSVLFNSNNYDSYELTIMDMTGRTIRNEIKNALKGDNLIDLDVSSYAKGIYVLSISSEKQNGMVRILVD